MVVVISLVMMVVKMIVTMKVVVIVVAAAGVSRDRGPVRWWQWRRSGRRGIARFGIGLVVMEVGRSTGCGGGSLNSKWHQYPHPPSNG